MLTFKLGVQHSVRLVTQQTMRHVRYSIAGTTTRASPRRYLRRKFEVMFYLTLSFCQSLRKITQKVINRDSGKKKFGMVQHGKKQLLNSWWRSGSRSGARTF